nr:hypothetical protein [Celerinatantimonas diazotrophica]
MLSTQSSDNGWEMNDELSTLFERLVLAKARALPSMYIAQCVVIAHRHCDPVVERIHDAGLPLARNLCDWLGGIIAGGAFSDGALL